MRPPPHLPFAVPYPTARRDSTATDGSISEASSSSEFSDERARVAYRDDPNDDGLAIESVPLPHSATATHSYPPTPSTVTANSNGTLRYTDVKEGQGGHHDNDDDSESQTKEADDDADAIELLDEEERVGLMMQDRRRQENSAGGRTRSRQVTSTITATINRATAHGKTKSLQRFKPFFLMGATMMAILVFVPLLNWLSSSTHTRRRESVLKSEKHLTEVIMPSYWRMPDAQQAVVSNSGIRKHKRPLPAGTSKLTEFGGPFALEHTVAPIASDLQEGKKKLITLDDALGSTFWPSTDGLQWSAEDPDEGVFIFQDPSSNDIILQDVTHLRKEKTGQGEVAKGGGKVTYMKAADATDAKGDTIDFDTYKVSPDMRFILLFSDRKKQWRHSSYSKVWLHDVSARTTRQLGKNLTEPTIATAEWSKRGYVSFVEGNNLFLIKDVHKPDDVLSITNDGTTDVFNAVPDWVYEEEVFSGDTAHWWSPDGNRIVFVRFDETAVKTYSFPIYNPTETNGKASLYPSMVNMKYPKPGTPIPILSVFVYDVPSATKSELRDPPTKTAAQGEPPLSIETSTVDAAMRTAGDKIMVTQLRWLNDRTLIMRETNRWSDAMRYVFFDTDKTYKELPNSNSTIVGTVARRESTTNSGGWITVDQDIRPIRTSTAASTAYVDIVAVPNGYRHIAYFKDASQAEPIFLTTGAWEVDKIIFVGNDRVYFSAAYPRPMMRHILYVDIPLNGGADFKPTDAPASLTNIKETAYYSANFDPKGNYYELTYEGPHVPWVKVFSLRDLKFELTLEDNAKVTNAVAQYHQPQRLFYNITLADGTVASAEEWRPHDFDGSGAVRYPVLIKVYGGPNSQTVQATWSLNNWQAYLASSLGYIVVLLDGRGTGFRGRAHRDVVSWHLGVYESLDVVQAAEQIRRLPYVAQSKVGVWGWSFGGYLTAKTLERDTGTFDIGMSVAPVSRWEFYDSIYTERYMKTPSLNKAGYENASVHVNKGFERTQYLLAQGSGDDNVHFQNSAHLLDQLTDQRIRGFWFRMFPDSSHTISTRGAYRELHEFMTRFLVYNWGAGGRRRFRYENDKGAVIRRDEPDAR